MDRANHIFLDFACFGYRFKECGFAIIVEFSGSHNVTD